MMKHSANSLRSRRVVLGLLACCAALGLGVAVPDAAQAQRFQLQQSLSPDEVRDRQRSVRTIPLREAVRIVRQRYDVRELLDAYTVADRDGEPRTHVVRIITYEGRRLDVHVNARSGAIERG